ncbi:hypothetical protein BGZ79_004511, partial [Entomortierella chlamydospora]
SRHRADAVLCANTPSTQRHLLQRSHQLLQEPLQAPSQEPPQEDLPHRTPHQITTDPYQDRTQ